MVNEYKNGDYSTLVEFENNIFRQNIDILKSWRQTLWDSVLKGTSAFLLPHMEGIYELKEEMTNYKQYASLDTYEEFLKEYDMTMVLLQKCLIKSVNEKLLPVSEEEQNKINDLISKIEIDHQKAKNMDSIILALREEDPSIQKVLENLGFPKEKIEEIIASGYTIDSILDIELISELKK